jgi:hypothetical protein
MKVGDLVRQARGQSRMIGVVVDPPEEVSDCGATMTGILWPDGDGGVCYHSTVWLEIVYENR